ncbi:hypothetical protein ABZ672_54040, partial [Streptomyces mirabilis]|uniref:hypothetical protein n=1 Tax=Streptomyces mirabilis TaxID=68239 RepID=UPI0033C344CB
GRSPRRRDVGVGARRRGGATHQSLEDTPVLIPGPLPGIGRPRPFRLGPRYPQRPVRLPGVWEQ